MSQLETRFMLPADNLIATANTIQWGNTEGGPFSGVMKQGLGSAVCSITQMYSGTKLVGFTGCEDIIYMIEINDVSAGKEVGQARFRWRINKTAVGSWEGTNVLTSSFPEGTVLNPSNNPEYGSVYIRFTSGTGNDFEAGDTFYIAGYAVFETIHMYDEQRNTYMQIYGSESQIPVYKHIWDMGNAVPVTVFALMDVMLSAGVTKAVLSAGTTSSCEEYSLDLLPLSKTNIHYLTQTYQFWCLEIRGLNPTPKIGQMFLGQYRVCTKSPSVDYGSGLSSQLAIDGTKKFSLKWETLVSEDASILQQIYDDSVDKQNHRSRPIFLHLFHTDLTSFYWVKVASDLSRTFKTFNIETAALELEEVKESYVI